MASFRISLPLPKEEVSSAFTKRVRIPSSLNWLLIIAHGYGTVRNFSIAVGPVLGGLLSNYFGFRSIFVFLLIISTITLAVIITFLPETMRSIAGNGSIRLDGMYRPLARYVRGDPEYVEQSSVKSSPRKKVTFMTFVEPLRLLIQKDILINLVFGGIIYAIWSMVTSSTTGLFKESFGLNELQIGLCYLPNGESFYLYESS